MGPDPSYGDRAMTAQFPHLTSLTLTDFRNYASAAVTLSPHHVVLTGPNGAGKTNLIEAVSLLSPGRGLRRAPLAAVSRKGAPGGFAVFARLVRDGETFEVGTGLRAGSGGDNGGPSRLIRINGTTARSADELLEIVRVLWLTPAMDGLFTGPASDRRRFVDRLVMAIDPAHGRRSASYEKAVRQRNRLLEAPLDSQTHAWLDTVEIQIAGLGAAIVAARQELADLLTTLQAQDAISVFPTAQITLTGTMEERVAVGESAHAVQDHLERSLRESRPRDSAAGRTLIGPHRADLSVHHGQKNMPAALCSTGEQKALLTGLVLAHAALTAQVSAITPILLLDEIAAHLDPDRRAALFDRIDAIGGQCFMTGTDRHLFDALGVRAQYLHVDDGKVSADG